MKVRLRSSVLVFCLSVPFILVAFLLFIKPLEGPIKPAKNELLFRTLKSLYSQKKFKEAKEKIEPSLEKLSPALRPIQITYDLKSFWENSYTEVKKELKGKYKRHYWPDNPFEAIATNRTKKNMHK